MFRRKRRSPDLSGILNKAADFGDAVASPEAYSPPMDAVELDVGGKTPRDLTPEEQLDSLFGLTKQMGFTRDETAALASMILRSIDDSHSMIGGISRTERELASANISLGGEALGMFGMITAKLFRPEALAEQADDQ